MVCASQVGEGDVFRHVDVAKERKAWRLRRPRVAVCRILLKVGELIVTLLLD